MPTFRAAEPVGTPLMEPDPATHDMVTDAGRLERLRGVARLGTAPAEGFDRLMRVVKRCLGVPVALVSLVDADRQVFAGQVGLPEPYATDLQTPLTHALCREVVRTGRPMVVTDARVDPVLRAHAAVCDIGVVAYAGVPLVTPDGHVLGALCAIDVNPREWTGSDLDTLRDLAEAVMAEVQLKQTTAAAEAANRGKDRFLAMLSHELRSPLSPVLLLSTALAEDASLPEAVRADAATICRNVRLQTRLVDDLLDVTRIENGKVTLASETVDLHALLAELLVDVRREADRKRLAVTLKPSDPVQFVRGDPSRLRQVFGNLVRNAVKFTPADGRVTVGATGGPEGVVRTSVCDTGIGVVPAALGRLFDPFEQGSRAITDEYSGLGLGLTIAKGLVEAHGGRIDVASDGPGRGTTFTVDLPAAAPPTARAAAVPRPAKSDGVNILLVEDHKDTLAAMARLLRRMGHQVAAAASVADAVRAAAAGPFDVLISDVDLPDGTGLDLMRELSAMPRTRPLRGIALTGYGMESDVRESEAAGFFAHLIKPIDLAKLSDAIRRATV